MNQALVDKIVQAVLYEGYILYPYRPSVKNHCRWTFGGIYPRVFVDANPGADLSRMQCQCIVTGSDEAEIRVTIRFLQLLERTTQPGGQTWQEAVERDIPIAPARLGALLANPQLHSFSFASSRAVEQDDQCEIVREQQAIEGGIEISTLQLAEGVFQLTVRIENGTALEEDDAANRDKALMRSLASTHVILNVCGGEFVSLTDAPEALEGFVGQCRNQGCWPVLIGEAGERDSMLASPIILYDYPRIAPESPGDLFDGTEIDEILSLRIMTLTEEEKRQAAATDDRVRQMVCRTDALARDQLMNLHGVFRGMSPSPTEAHHA